MAIAVVQTASGQSSNTATATVTLGTPTTLGNSLIVFACVSGTTSNGSGITAVTLGGSGTGFSQLLSEGNSSDHAISACWANSSIASGQTSVVITETSAAGSFGMVAYAVEVSGLATVSVLDRSAVFTSSGFVTTWSVGPTAATTQAVEITFGFVGGNSSGVSTITGPASLWTNLAQVTNTTTGSGFNLDALASYQILASTGAITYAGTSSGTGTTLDGLVVTLKGAAAATVTTQTTAPNYRISRNYPAPPNSPASILAPQYPANIPVPPIHENQAVLPQSFMLRAAPYPLNITTRLRPQNPASVPGVYVTGLAATTSVQALQGTLNVKIPGITAADSVTANTGVIKASIPGVTATVNAQAFTGNVSVRSVTHIQNAFPPDQPYPLSVIGQAKNLIPQHPASIAKTFVSGVTATATVAANFGTLKTSLTVTPSTVTVSAFIGGEIAVPQTTTLPTHGWPYFSRKYFVTQSKPNVYLAGVTAVVSGQAPTGVVKSSVPGIVSNVSASAAVGSFFIFQAQAKQNPYPRYSPYPLGLRNVSPQHPQFPQPPNGTIPGITAVVNVQALFGTVSVVKPGLAASVNTSASTGQFFIFSPVAKTFPLAPVVPYPLNITNRGLRVTFSYIPSTAPVNVNIAGLTAAVTSRTSLGLIAVISPYSKPFPFTNAPWPLNVISRLKPQYPTARPVVAIAGLRASVAVTSLSGSVKAAVTGTVSPVSITAVPGTLKATVPGNVSAVNIQALTGTETAGTSVKLTTWPNPYPRNTIYPFTYKIRVQRSQTIPTGVSVHVTTAVVTVSSNLGSAVISVNANVNVLVKGYAGSSTITGSPVYSWNGKLLKPATGKLYTNIRYNPS